MAGIKEPQTCAHGELLGGDCNACPWAYEAVDHGDDGSSGGCRDCAHVDGTDERGTFMLRFYTEPGSGDVVCPACYLKMRIGESATVTQEIERVIARQEAI